MAVSIIIVYPYRPDYVYIHVHYLAMAWSHIHTCTSPLPPAEYPCWQHLTCRPIWMGPLEPSQQPRAVCTSAVCRPGSWGRVCYHHCLLHQRTAQLACSHLCFQVLGEGTLGRDLEIARKERLLTAFTHRAQKPWRSLVHFIMWSMHPINPGTWSCPLSQQIKRQIKRHEIDITIYMYRNAIMFCVWETFAILPFLG